MKLSDCRSYSLLPKFARNAFMESLCGAVDELVRTLAARCNALPCENSAASLAVCRDDELAQIADDLGVVPYYHDLPRTTRENQILQAKTWTRYAGTSGSVIAMVNALFDTDNTVIDDERPDDFHYLIDISDNFVESTEINFRRFNECLSMLGHTTTTPEGFIFRYDGTFETSATAISGDVLLWFDTNQLCTLPNIYAIRGGEIGADSDFGYRSKKWLPIPVCAMSMGGGMMADEMAQNGGTFRLHSDYTPIYPAYEFPQYDGTETVGQLGGGTLRLFGTNANQEVDKITTPSLLMGELELGMGGLITGGPQIGGVVGVCELELGMGGLITGGPQIGGVVGVCELKIAHVSAEAEITRGNQGDYWLYDEDNHSIPWDESVTYTFVRCYRADMTPSPVIMKFRRIAYGVFSASSTENSPSGFFKYIEYLQS